MAESRLIGAELINMSVDAKQLVVRHRSHRSVHTSAMAAAHTYNQNQSKLAITVLFTSSGSILRQFC